MPHAFSTRVGGVSGGDFSTLNFGNPGDLPSERRDPPSNISENWRRLKAALASAHMDAPSRVLVEVHQVHGRDVQVFSAASTREALAESRHTKADAIVTDHPAALAAVRVADCAPVLIASNDGEVVAAVHAGWRGTIANVVGAAVDAMRELRPNACARGLSAAIGPCIGAEAFEVGPDVVVEVERVIAKPWLWLRPGQAQGKYMLDLKGVLRHQLAGAGVREVEVLSGCTFSRPEWFFSHRRDALRSGRMVGVIGPRGG